ncbi:hypothetical protein [Dyadobacter sp. CY312]|uniref:hypothetical protein n=1 Tax=Dyadobacter sp. CY312 TaxID=2907303 RepID=UPI001F29F9D0|nr:hypothetical protein [Dyadobacter sp. CY312]MCE7042422.1 hypothetical protein [Dyadobacter sp. CY312]
MMYRKLLCKLFLLTFLAPVTLVRGQDNIGLRFVFGTLHPQGEKMAFLMPNKLDKNAVAVLNWGFIGSYQRYIYKKRFSLKVAQGAYSDCARLFAGHTHLGFRVNFLNGKKHALEFGFGPTFVYRESWNRFEGYVQDTKLLKNTKNWQWNFVWYGGELEYDYSVSKNLDLNINCIPGYPKFFTFAVGARYWLRPIRSNREYNQDR